jgi:hypothetical protein
MKSNVLFFLIFMIAFCTHAISDGINSPSGLYSVIAEISGEEAGPTRRLCVRLKVTEVTTKKEMIFQTGASDVQKWAISWSAKNVIVLYSSDIGTHSYIIKNGKIIEHQANEDEKEVGRRAYEEKYGKRPRH